MDDTSTRRDFLKTTAATLGGAAVVAAAGTRLEAQHPTEAPETILFRAPALDRVRVGFVGVGGMGTVHLGNYLSLEGVEVKAVCDIDPSHADRARKMIVADGQPEPTLYTRGDHDFERMCAEQDLDLVFNATPWEWHVPVLLAALKNGKHGATEVPAAYRVDDCWALVEAHEKYKKHCVMMENCCYDRREMLALMLVRKGILGEVLHGECGYLHDLRSEKFSTKGEGLWRRAHATEHDGNWYPTHGIGPIAQCMNINRGNRFDFLVSMSSPQRGLTLYAEEHLAADDPRRKETVQARRRQRHADPDGAGADDLPGAQHRQPPAVQPDQHGPGDEGAHSGLARPDLHRGPKPEERRVGRARQVTTRSSSTRCGNPRRSSRPIAATAAWTSSKTIASSSACARACRPT